MHTPGLVGGFDGFDDAMLFKSSSSPQVRPFYTPQFLKNPANVSRIIQINKNKK